MSDDEAAVAGFDGLARLFPLPNLVLFPHVVQGLHIFEQRYRELMADTLAADGLMALAVLRPGWEDEYDAAPGIEPAACLGRVVWHERLPDGRYNLRLKGVARVRLVEEVPTGKLYRASRADVLTDVVPADLSRLVALRRRLADAVLPRFAADGPAYQQLQTLFAGEMPLGQVCDVLAYALPLAGEFKLDLLADPHVAARAEGMAAALESAAARTDRKFPPEFSPN